MLFWYVHIIGAEIISKSDVVDSGDAYHKTAISEVSEISDASESGSSIEKDDTVITAEAEESESIPDDISTETLNTTDDTSTSDGLVPDITPDPSPGWFIRRGL